MCKDLQSPFSGLFTVNNSGAREKLLWHHWLGRWGLTGLTFVSQPKVDNSTWHVAAFNRPTVATGHSQPGDLNRD
jgi:hypothetical protein